MRHVNPPTAVPQTDYSHVVEAIGKRTLYVAGQIALDAEGRVIGVGDFRAQAGQVFANLKSALEAAGASLSNVVSYTAFVTDMSALAIFREVRDACFQAPRPAGSLVQVAALVRPELLLEVDAVAVVE